MRLIFAEAAAAVPPPPPRLGIPARILPYLHHRYHLPHTHYLHYLRYLPYFIIDPIDTFFSQILHRAGPLPLRRALAHPSVRAERILYGKT